MNINLSNLNDVFTDSPNGNINPISQIIPQLQHTAPLELEDPDSDSVTESETESDREKAHVQSDGRKRIGQHATEAQNLRTVTNTYDSATESDTSVGNSRASGSQQVLSSDIENQQPMASDYKL